MQIFDSRMRALDYVAREGRFDNSLRIERAIVLSGEYYIVTRDISDVDDVYWTYEGGLDFAGAKGFEHSRLFESYEGVVNGSQLEYNFPDLGEIEDDEEVYAYRLEWHVVHNMDLDEQDNDDFSAEFAGWCITLHDMSV